MTFRLTVADHLAPLADTLASELTHAPADPFAPQLVVVTGEGVRTWLSARLAHRLGAPDGRGIVANVEFAYPSTLVRRAITTPDTSPSAAGDVWQVGPLTWAVYRLLRSPVGPAIGQPPDLAVARVIADRFDRYALHRAGMVQAWEHGHDVDAAGHLLSATQQWQPQLWRLLVDHIGRASNVDVVQGAVRGLQEGTLEPDLPGHLWLFGLSAMPTPHLQVLAALSARHQVHVLAPTPSVAMWRNLAPAASSLADTTPSRANDPSASIVRHPLSRTWAVTARESLLLLAATASKARADIVTLDPVTPEDAPVPTLLGRLQHHIHADEPPPTPEGRPLLDPADHSVVWHRCHGAGRQAEVLRDQILHLLQEHGPNGSPTFQPRDIVVLCPDVARYAPLVEAVFVGDPAHGVPDLPLQVADRSVRQEVPLLDAVGALLDLLEGRFRASDVLAFAERPPIRRRFGLDTAEIGLLAEWAEATCIRWGLDRNCQERFGLPEEITAYTWRFGLDQLLVGSALPDHDGTPHLGPLGVVPYPGIEADRVVSLGKVAELVTTLERAFTSLSRAAPPDAWCRRLAESAAELFEVPDLDAWHWHLLAQLLDEVVADAAPTDPNRSEPIDVPVDELARYLSTRLDGLPGRARFGSGSITLSSLVAQRGLPYPVVCLLGLDTDLGGGSIPSPDDLIAAEAFVGDRDPQRELRAVLLDVVLAAGERLVICSTGRSVQTNAEVPPAVPLAELADLIDATMVAEPAPGGGTRRASDQIAIDHPRQSWSERNFVAGALGRAGAFSFDQGALAAAQTRHDDDTEPRDPSPTHVLPHVDTSWTLDDIEKALINPVRSLLQGRLGVSVPGDRVAVDDLVPLEVAGLDRWTLRNRLMRTRLAAGDAWDDHQASRCRAALLAEGTLPPLAFGQRALDTAEQVVESLLAAAGHAGAPLHLPAQTLAVQFRIDGQPIDGEIAGVFGHTLLWVTPSELTGGPQIASWLRLAALAVSQPDAPWQAVVVGSGSGSKPPTSIRLQFASVEQAEHALGVALDLAQRTRRNMVPALVRTTYALHEKGLNAAEAAWHSHNGFGESTDRWVLLGLGMIDFDTLVAEAPLPDEAGDEWGDDPSRLVRWATRLWGTYEQAVLTAAGAAP